MTLTKTLTFTSAAAIALMAGAFSANADILVSSVDTGVNAAVSLETPIAATTKKTTITTNNNMNVMAYDLNGDGILSMPEVGEKLFYEFDADGNESLDNVEFNKAKVITVEPVEQTTVVETDIDGDGVVDSQTVESAIFLDQTGLARFDNDGDGLTPREFIGESLLELDTDKSGLVELDEWKTAYVNSHAAFNANNDIYNNGQ